MKGTRYASLRCEKDQTLQERLQQAKDEGSFPCDAYRGPVARNLQGFFPPPSNKRVVGQIQDNLNISYYILSDTPA